MMKKTLLASALLAVTSTSALAEVSGNVGFASDYVFRGYSQTDNQIALQGGLDYAHDSGFYVGTWASNVSSPFFGGTHDPQLELDVYGGYSAELSNGIGYDLGILHYDYPGASYADTDELYISGSMAGFTVSFNYSDELAFVGSTESAWYLAAGYEMDLPMDVGLSLHIGLNDGDAFDGGPGAAFSDNYIDWSVGLSKNIAGLDFGLTYTDLDQSSTDETNFCGNSSICDGKVVLSVSKSL